MLAVFLFGYVKALIKEVLQTLRSTIRFIFFQHNFVEEMNSGAQGPRISTSKSMMKGFYIFIPTGVCETMYRSI